MMERRMELPSLNSLRSSPHPESGYDISAPSPDSIAASPMLISSRNSECGDLPIESDEGYSISDSGETSRRSTLSRMDLNELIRDIEVKNKYPELYTMIVAHRRATSSESGEGMQEGELVSHCNFKLENREGLYCDALELLKRCRKLERKVREVQKTNDELVAANKQIKETYVKIYAKAEQEEEYISNILLKRIQKLKNDKETLAQKYEQEEEFLTNDLLKRIQQLQSERDVLEGKVKNEQAVMIDNLLMTIRRMESEMAASRKNIDRMRKDKIDQENALEHEQELLFNTLGKQMDRLNSEKRKMQISLQQAYIHGYVENEDEIVQEMEHSNEHPIFAEGARTGQEVQKLRSQLKRAENILQEYKDRDERKSSRIRYLESALSTMGKMKDDMGRQMDVVITRAQQKGESSSHNRDMGPPLTHPIHRQVDGDTTDMDDSSSRGSLSHSDFSMT